MPSGLSSAQTTLFQQAFPAVLLNEPMSRHTSMRVGGPASLFFVAKSGVELCRAVEQANKQSIPWYVFGGGSNLLVADEGFAGLVIQMAGRALQISPEGTVTADSGVISSLLARQSVEAGFTGLEWAVGLPGTVGGAVYGNAGCYGGEIKDYLQSVEVFDSETGKRTQQTKEECGFGYRTSFFKQNKKCILSACFQLPPNVNQEQSRVNMQHIIEQRKEKQPLQQSSAGCAFTNVPFFPEQITRIESQTGELPSSMRQSGVISSGWLIDHLGLCGYGEGAVRVSEKHGNFLVNTGAATAQDVRHLISVIQQKVFDLTGLTLHPEVQLLGFPAA